MEGENFDAKAREELEKDFGVGRKRGAGADLGPPAAPGRAKRVLAACGCILGNEVCERLAYYGLQTNMGLYLKQYLGYDAGTASQLLQVWKATVYLTPLLGAFLADAYMGRFLVILVFSVIYIIGLAGVTAANLIPSIRPRFNAPPLGGDYGAARAMVWAFLYLVALGSGGIKPCVSSFGGDQFDDGSARERKWRSSFFNWFYFSINIGSLVATLVVVPVQENKGYGIGFGIPTAAMAAALLLFIFGAVIKLYTKVPPEGSPFYRIYRVLRGAVANRGRPLPESAAELYEAPAGDKDAVAFRMPHTERMRCLDRAALRDDASAGNGAGAGAAATASTSAKKAASPPPVGVTEVEETKSFLAILPVFLLVTIWQMTYDPIFSLLPYPGDAMDRRIGSGGFKIPASSISFANTAGVLLAIPLYDVVVVPLALRMGRPISMVARIGIGFVVQLLALLSAGFIETARYRALRTSGYTARWAAAAAADPKLSYDDAAWTQPVSIWWQFIPYFLLGAAEAFTNVGVLELFFTQVSEGMRALGASMYLLSVAVGTYMASALNIIVAKATASDPWVADNPVYGHYDYYFYLNAGILAAAFVGYVLVTRRFEEKPLAGGKEESEDPLNRETRVHSDLGNAVRSWPSVASHGGRLEELRARSSVASMRRRSSLAAGAASAGAAAAVGTVAEEA